MFFNVLLASLLVSAAFAAPPPAVRDAPTPLIRLESNVSYPSVVAPGSNPGPPLSVILLNSPSASPPVASGYYGDDAAPLQPSPSPALIDLNATPAASPPVIKLNKRQKRSTPPFSFGGIVPTTTPTPTPPFSIPGTTTTSSSFSSSSLTPAPLPTTPTNPAAPGLSILTSRGTDGIQTVFVLSAVTVTVTPSCTFSPAVPSSEPPPAFPPAQLPTTSPSVLPSIVPSSSPPAVSSPLDPIDLNAPPATPPPSNTGFSFSSGSTPTPTPTPFPVNAASPSSSCGFECSLTASV
ncbi:hypothetical protein EI94DRAFT_1719518 [Lactarius quietus]|nr:hypothetical protein EI94DRAFT_1719518 [Lactarius quietus]